MDYWSIILIFFLGVFSHRVVSSLLNYTHSYNFIIYCFACCLTLIKGSCKEANRAKDRILELARETNLSEEELRKIENKFNKIFADWETNFYIRTLASIPPVFKKALQAEAISAKLSEAFKEINK